MRDLDDTIKWMPCYFTATYPLDQLRGSLQEVRKGGEGKCETLTTQLNGCHATLQQHTQDLDQLRGSLQEVRMKQNFSTPSSELPIKSEVSSFQNLNHCSVLVPRLLILTFSLMLPFPFFVIDMLVEKILLFASVFPSDFIPLAHHLSFRPQLIPTSRFPFSKHSDEIRSTSQDISPHTLKGSKNKLIHISKLDHDLGILRLGKQCSVDLSNRHNMKELRELDQSVPVRDEITSKLSSKKVTAAGHILDFPSSTHLSTLKTEKNPNIAPPLGLVVQRQGMIVLSVLPSSNISSYILPGDLLLRVKVIPPRHSRREREFILLNAECNRSYPEQLDQCANYIKQMDELCFFVSRSKGAVLTLTIPTFMSTFPSTISIIRRKTLLRQAKVQYSDIRDSQHELLRELLSDETKIQFLVQEEIKSTSLHEAVNPHQILLKLFTQLHLSEEYIPHPQLVMLCLQEEQQKGILLTLEEKIIRSCISCLHLINDCTIPGIIKVRVDEPQRQTSHASSEV